MALLALCGALHTSPPPLASSTPTRAELKELTAGLRSIPIAVGYALASLGQNVALPTKARVAVLDVLASTLGKLYVTGAGEPLKAVDLHMEKAIARGLDSTERSIRMAARSVLARCPCRREPSSWLSLARFSRCILAFFAFYAASPIFAIKTEGIFDTLCRVLGHGSAPSRETALTTIGALGKTFGDETLMRRIGSQLVVQLGESDPWMKSLAHSTVRLLWSSQRAD
jgi:hypothetical protein